MRIVKNVCLHYSDNISCTFLDQSTLNIIDLFSINRKLPLHLIIYCKGAFTRSNKKLKSHISRFKLEAIFV